MSAPANDSSALTRRIAALAQSVRHLIDGGPQEPMDLDGNDELAELARAVDTLGTALQQAQQELRVTRAQFEQRIVHLTTANHALIQEIAERTQNDQALRESEARLSAMARAIPDLVLVIDEDGRYREILAAGRDLATVGNTRIRGKLLSEVHSPDMAEFFLGLIHRALKTRQT